MAENNPTSESKVQSVVAEVADRIKNSGDAIKQRLVDSLVEREVAQRVDLLDKAIQRRVELSRELSKVNRPDNVMYNADGSEAGGTYTKQRIDEIKKAREALEKHENAIEKALTSNDFSKLKGG